MSPAPALPLFARVRCPNPAPGMERSGFRVGNNWSKINSSGKRRRKIKNFPHVGCRFYSCHLRPLQHTADAAPEMPRLKKALPALFRPVLFRSRCVALKTERCAAFRLAGTATTAAPDGAVPRWSTSRRTSLTCHASPGAVGLMPAFRPSFDAMRFGLCRDSRIAICVSFGIRPQAS